MASTAQPGGICVSYAIRAAERSDGWFVETMDWAYGGCGDT